MSDLNHLPSNKKNLDNEAFINAESKEDSTREYVNKVSKESGWIPCLLLCLNYFIYFQSIFWME